MTGIPIIDDSQGYRFLGVAICQGGVELGKQNSTSLGQDLVEDFEKD